MKIYLDLVFFLNFAFDLLLLVTVKLILKRKVAMKRLLLGAFFGGITIFSLFFSLSSVMLFLFKVITSFLMILISFGRKGFFKNTIYLYFTSILLGGFLTLLNNTFSYKSEGFLFFFNGFSIHWIVLLLLSPIICIWYFHQAEFFSKYRRNTYQVQLQAGRKKQHYTAFLDTGNQLYDPYFHRPVSLLYDPKFVLPEKVIYVPYETVGGTGLLPCVFFDSLQIEEQTYQKVLVGIVEQPFRLSEVSFLLHPDFLK